MKNLISMTDFVLEQVQNSKYEDFNKVNETFVNKVINFANFLSLKLEIWMFVPCDEYGNVMKEPYEIFYEESIMYENYMIKYCKAKERCLFEGFRYDGFKYLDYKNYSFRIIEIKNMKIEDLVKYNLQLTQTAIKW